MAGLSHAVDENYGIRFIIREYCENMPTRTNAKKALKYDNYVKRNFC